MYKTFERVLRNLCENRMWPRIGVKEHGTWNMGHDSVLRKCAGGG